MSEVRMPTISWLPCPLEPDSLIEGREYLLAVSVKGNYVWEIGEWQDEFKDEVHSFEPLFLVGNDQMDWRTTDHVVMCGLLPEGAIL